MRGKIMNRFNKSLTMSLAITLLVLCSARAAIAGDEVHKLVIQVSSGDPATQNMALNNAVNVQKELGLDNVIIEIVAYGPGLSMLTPKSHVSERVPSLSMQNMTFSACGNTMQSIEEKTGTPVTLVEGVQIVKAGVVRIMELQEQGYSYVRP
jgi:uncharacterized protein